MSKWDTGVDSDLAIVRRALTAAAEYFVRRDQMNAVVHLSATHYSPVTQLVQEGLEATGRLRGATHV